MRQLFLTVTIALCGCSLATAGEPLEDSPVAPQLAPPLMAPQATAARPLADARDEQLLFLTNGQVLRGRISQDGDRYVVTTQRAEARIGARDVEFVCHSLAEGYRLKRASITQNNARDHLRLAQWCLTQGMLNEADQERQQAAEIEPTHPRLALLDRQLKLAREPVAPQPAPVKMPQPIGEAPLNSPVRSLPGPTVESFSRTVQPLLLNNCAAVGCHGPATKSDFQLIRLQRGETPIRRVTQRNLAAVLNYLDPDNPDQSRLLIAATQPHGGASKATFSRTDQAAFRHLAQWVRQVNPPPATAQNESLDPPATTLSQSIPAGQSPTVKKSPHTSATPRPMHDKPKRQEPGKSDRDAESAPDPMDPDLFNRRYHPAPPAAKEQTVPKE